MERPAEPPPPAPRLPLPTTFGGVAALAQGSGVRLLGWQVATAVAIALVVTFSLDATWGDALDAAAARLPDRAAVQEGRLEWPETEARVLHDGPLLSIVVDPADRRENAPPSDVTVLLGSDRIIVRSILGWLAVPYPATGRWSLARLDMAGVLAAWRGPVLLLVGASIALVLLAGWAGLAAAYALGLWLLSAPLGRPVPYRLAWRLSLAALLPGAAVMATAIGLYAARQLSLIGLMVALPLHVLTGWLFLAGGWSRLRRRSGPGGNPFATPPPSPSPAARGVRPPENPFRDPP